MTTTDPDFAEWTHDELHEVIHRPEPVTARVLADTTRLYWTALTECVMANLNEADPSVPRATPDEEHA